MSTSGRDGSGTKEGRFACLSTWLQPPMGTRRYQPCSDPSANGAHVLCDDGTVHGRDSSRTNPHRIFHKVWQQTEEHTSELQSLRHLVCRLLLEKKKKQQ